MSKYVSLVLVLLLLAACGGAPQAAAPAEDGATEATTTEDAATDAPAAQAITVAFSYIPNVQFAPFYVADQKGYYAEEGITPTFDYNFETDVLQRLAAGDVQFAHGSGLSTMLARQQGLPVSLVMMQYQQFPVVFFSKGDVPLASPEDMIGRSVGLPGRFGASYYALLAVLYASDLAESDMNVQEIGFNQLQLVLEDQIEIAAGYAMNEPVKLAAEGSEVNMLRVADVFPLVGDGVITNEAIIADNPELVRGFVRATVRGLADTLADPEEALAISQAYIPEMENVDFEREVLQTSLAYWQADTLGTSDPAAWEQSYQFLLDLELLNAPIEYEQAFTNEFIPDTVSSNDASEGDTTDAPEAVPAAPDTSDDYSY